MPRGRPSPPPDPERMQHPNGLWWALRDHGVSQAELARRLGVGPQNVSDHVRGEVTFTLEKLCQWARAIDPDCRPLDLLTESQRACFLGADLAALAELHAGLDARDRTTLQAVAATLPSRRRAANG